MPDNTDTTDNTQQETAQAQDATQQQTLTPDGAGEPHGDPAQDMTDWKAQARKWEKLAKANHEKAEQADQLREKAEKADQLQAQLDKLTAAKQWEQTLSKVSKDTGIPVDVLNLVDADSEDKLTEAAKTLQAYAQADGKRAGMGDQSRSPEPRRQSDAAAFLASVNKRAGY